MSGVWIVIVDNGSSDKETKAVRDWLGENWDGDYKYSYSPKPLGFVKAVNIGMQECKNLDYFIVMNNDTLVTHGWLERLIDTLKKDDVGLVGPVSSPPDWRELPMGKSFIEQKLKYKQISGSLNGFTKQLIQHFDGVEQGLDFIAFYCVGMKTKIVQEIGQLDEIYNLGLFDDDDYCHRIKQAGYKIVLRRDVYVHHYHNSTFLEKHGKEKYMELLEENRKIFKKKWGIDPWDRCKKPEAI